MNDPNPSKAIRRIKCRSKFISKIYCLKSVFHVHIIFSVCYVYLKWVILLFLCLQRWYLMFCIFYLCLHSQHQLIRVGFFFFSFFFFLRENPFQTYFYFCFSNRFNDVLTPFPLFILEMFQFWLFGDICSMLKQISKICSHQSITLQYIVVLFEVIYFIGHTEFFIYLEKRKYIFVIKIL